MKPRAFTGGGAVHPPRPVKGGGRSPTPPKTQSYDTLKSETEE